MPSHIERNKKVADVKRRVTGNGKANAINAKGNNRTSTRNDIRSSHPNKTRQCDACANKCANANNTIGNFRPVRTDFNPGGGATKVPNFVKLNARRFGGGQSNRRNATNNSLTSNRNKITTDVPIMQMSASGDSSVYSCSPAFTPPPSSFDRLPVICRGSENYSTTSETAEIPIQESQGFFIVYKDVTAMKSRGCMSSESRLTEDIYSVPSEASYANERSEVPILASNIHPPKCPSNENSLKDFKLKPKRPAPEEVSGRNSEILSQLKLLMDLKKREIHAEPHSHKLKKESSKQHSKSESVYNAVIQDKLSDVAKKGSMVKSIMNKINLQEALAKELSPRVLECRVTQKKKEEAKNVPSLQQEIKLLKCLQSNFDETQKRSKEGTFLKTTESLPREYIFASASIVCAPKPIRFIAELVHYKYDLALATDLVAVDVSLADLKKNEDSCFYLPCKKEGFFELTNFDKLKQRPEQFMQHMKLKRESMMSLTIDLDNSDDKLSLLSDTVYLSGGGHMVNVKCGSKKKMKPLSLNRFNGQAFGNLDIKSAMYHMCLQDSMSKLSKPKVKTLYKADERKLKQQSSSKSVCEAKAMAAKKSTKKTETVKSVVASKARKSSPQQQSRIGGRKVDKSRMVYTASGNKDTARTQQRHPDVTKMAVEKDSFTKRLLKTVLVGTVQTALFLLLIVGLTYPEPRCSG